MAFSTLLCCSGWQACSGHMTLEYWLVVQNIQGLISIVLMALVDADYKFLWIDVGSNGSTNDASIYNGSELKEGVRTIYSIFLKRSLYLVMTFLSHIHSRGQCFRDRQEPDEPIFYQKHGTPRKNIYFNNYRLSRARRVVENAFGILHVAHKFKVIPWGQGGQWPRGQRHGEKIITVCVILPNVIRLRYRQSTSGCLPWESQEHWNLGRGKLENT